MSQEFEGRCVGCGCGLMLDSGCDMPDDPRLWLCWACLSEKYVEVIQDIPNPSAIPAVVAALRELARTILTCDERKLLALDDDPHPPSSLSVLAEEARKALAALDTEAKG